jgi:hypothetical protein
MACSNPNYLPRFQAQNPAISHDPNGWVNCTAYAAAMAADFDTCGKVYMTGQRVRALSDERTPDPRSPGLNLAQVDDALRRMGVDLDTRYRLPWDTFAARINAGQGAVLQINTRPLLSTPYRATAGAIGHAIFVPPGWGVMDPAADGRGIGRGNYHEYDAKAYPRDLLRRAAGELVLGHEADGTPIVLGLGRVFASFTRDQRAIYRWSLHPLGSAKRRLFYVYTVKAGAIVTRRLDSTGGVPPTLCTPPRRYPRPGHASVSLVQLREGSRRGRWVDARWAEETTA